MSRGDTANHLTQLAVAALRWCHPEVRVMVVDANDEPTLSVSQLGDVDVVHIRPGADAISEVVGIGSRTHMFYWRHSPEVLDRIPQDVAFAASIDSDILIARPMDLGALTGPLSRGRIATAVDESTVAYFTRLGDAAPALTSVLPSTGTGGPLLQAGLVFTNPRDDDGLFARLWELGGTAARAGILDVLPFDDMSLLSAVLGQGGPLWERHLAIGHEWNYITAGDQDPGPFGVGAHHGGFRAKALLLENPDAVRAPTSVHDAWGATTSAEASTRRMMRGVVRGRRLRAPVGSVRTSYRLRAPSTLTWRTPPSMSTLTVRVLSGADSLSDIVVYRDGVLLPSAARAGADQWSLAVASCHTVTVVLLTTELGRGSDVTLERSFH